MDPYIEQPDLFPDFQQNLIVAIKAALQTKLRPRYAVLGRNRIFVVESDKANTPIILPALSPGGSRQPTASGMASDIPAVFELTRDEIRQPFVEIVEPAFDNRVVTVIEVLDPHNKQRGVGRQIYRENREANWASKANLVEIDLLREGSPTVRVSTTRLETLRPWHYLTAVSRRWPARQEVYAVPLQRRLPRIAVPVDADENDIVLDLQAVFTRCWDDGPYPDLLNYEGPPPGTWTADELAWCDTQLQAAGYRPTPPAPPPTS
jgi:hypothetical protein